MANPSDPSLNCVGRRACTNGVFQDCELPQETCDEIDNNCDGFVDEGFVDPMTGLYSLNPQHCGRCNFDCARLEYANADGVCQVEGETVGCRMECREGFVDLDNGTDDGCECRQLDDEDVPDGLDKNCDGVDGDRRKALFVSKIGSDDGAGTLDDPP